MASVKTLKCLVMGLALLVAACGGEEESTTTSTSSTSTTTMATTTTTLALQGEMIVSTGDVGPLVRSLQFLLLCNGYEETVVDGRDEGLVVDGVYGSVTGAFVALAQQDLGFRPNPAGVSGDVLLALGAECNDTRSITFAAESMQARVEAYLGTDVSDRIEFRASEGQTVTITADDPITLGITSPSGSEVIAPSSTAEVVFDAPETGSYLIEASATSEGLYGLTIEIPPPPSALVLQSTGLDFVDFGDPAEEVLETLTAILGAPTDDSGWTDAGGICVNHRLVTFGDGELLVDFTDAGLDREGAATYAPGGTEHFAAWETSLPVTDPASATLPRLETPSGLAVGDPAASVEEIYGDRVEVSETGFSILEGVITGELGPLPDAAVDTTDDASDADTGEAVVLSMRSGARLCEADG